MATTSIHAITQTVNLSIDYVMRNKTEKGLKDDIADSIRYAMNDKTGEVTYYTLTSTLNCANPDNPAEDFYAVINTYGARELMYGNAKTKDGAPVLAWHLVQSFDGQLDPRIANEIGHRLAEEIFGDFTVVISTHTNTENTHNHIEFCAWDKNGKKWNDCHETKRLIRKVSDRLCEEYGLSVLEGTRDMKLIRYQDSEGKTHYYEPTARKNEMIRQREAGELSPDDVGSYRNTIPYELADAEKRTNVEIVKQAIDEKLPFATSYDHLLDMLREMGFTIRAKKKNGAWMEHISFKPPTADRGVRDTSIGDDGYYTRVHLTELIEQRNAERRRREAEASRNTIPYYDEYVYGEIDVQAINEDYRADRTPSGGIKIVQRGEAERDIIRDTKLYDSELSGLYDTYLLKKLIAENRAAAKRKEPAKKREDMMIRRIEENFENLRFIERKQIYNYAQVNNIVKGLWGQYNACLAEINRTEDMLTKLEAAVNAPRVVNEIMARMSERQNDPEYMIEQYHKDAEQLRACRGIMKKYGITDAKSVQSLESMIEKYRDRISSLQISLTNFSKDLSDYSRCMRVLSRIDGEHEHRHDALFRDYEAIVRDGQQQAAQREAERDGRNKKKGRDR